MSLSHLQIASICHETNRAYCLALGDSSQLPWSEAPQWQRDSAIVGASFALSAPRLPEDSHNSWLAEKKADGWVYGPEKDAVRKLHPCCVPYSELPESQKLKDKLFLAICSVFKSKTDD